MKKIFLTLIAMAAFIVSCDKHAVEEPISAQELSDLNVENKISPEDLSQVVGILNDLGFTGEDIQNAAPPKGAPSAARTAGTSTATNCIDNRPEIPTGKTAAVDFQYLPINDSSGWFVIRGGGDIPLILNRPIVRFLVGESTEDIDLQLFTFNNGAYSAAIPLGNLPYNVVFSTAVLGADGFVSIDKTDLFLDSLTPAVSEDAAAASMACGGIDYSQFYTISPAPFPLNGFLATILTSAELTAAGLTLPNPSANYAATSTPTLIQAIEADLAQ